MTRDDIERLWFQALHESVEAGEPYIRHRFAALVAAAERERMVADGWRQCAVGQKATQFCGLVEEAVAAEREACAQVCEHNANLYIEYSTGWEESIECAEDIRARGEK